MEVTKVEDIIRMDDEVIALQYLRVGNIRGLQLDRLTNCKSLSLHRNLIHKSAPFILRERRCHFTCQGSTVQNFPAFLKKKPD